MASVFSHPAVVLGLRPVFGRPCRSRRVWLLGAACSAIPDMDAAGYWFGIPYGRVLGHRGLTHSVAFAAALAFVLARSVFRGAKWDSSRLAIGAFLFLCTASHGILDAMSNGGLGVAFFAPFDNRRCFLPWRPIEVSPIGTRGFFGARGLAILESELVWVWLPSVALGALASAARRARK
jgi:inner membrane protein